MNTALGCGPSIECLPERSVLAGVEPSAVWGVRNGTNLVAILPAGTEPMVPKFRRPLCLGERGDKVLIQGHVLSQIVNVQASGPLPRPDFSEDLIGSALPVKLRVRRCKFPGWVYIDADRSILMDGGEELEIQVVAPQSWVVLPAPDSPAETPVDLQVVDIKIRACVACCPDPPRSYLTTYDSLLQAPGYHARPRRATELFIATGAAGVPANSSWHWESQGGGWAGGNFLINGAVVNQPIYPGAAEVLVLDSVNGPQALLVWRIE